jgi:hypothetical protein
VGLGAALSSCTVAVAGGVAAAMLGGAALTAGCYDPVDITVLDGVTGLRACDARVLARSTDGAEAAFSSCFHAELPVGTWTVTADRLGYQPVSAALVVSKGRRCERALQTIEISMMPLGVAPAAPVPIRPPLPGEAPLSPGALPVPASIGVEQGAPGSPRTASPPPPTGVSSSNVPSASPPNAPAPSGPASGADGSAAPAPPAVAPPASSAAPSSPATPAPSSGSAAPPR